jgi:hypothetical protein
MCADVSQFSNLMRPRLHDWRENSTAGQIVDLLFQVRPLGFLISGYELNGASSHQGRSIPILSLKAAPGLQPMASNIFGPMLRECRDFASPRHCYKVVYSVRAAEFRGCLEDHYEIAAVAAVKSIKVQNLPG